MNLRAFKHLAAIAAMVFSLTIVQSAAAAGVTTQVFTSAGSTIHVDVYAASAAGTHPSIVFLYGSDGMSILPWSYTALASWYASQGYNFYIVHYFDRTGTTFGDLVSDFKNFPVWSQTITDATTWVASQPGVDAQRIGIMGMSLGSYLAIYQAGHDRRIKALADWYGGVVDAGVTYMPPTLILHGASDPIVPVSEAYKLQSLEQTLGTPCQMHIYPGEGHGFNLTDEFDALQRTLTFFVQYLGK